MFHVLRAIGAENIITGEEKEPAPIDLDFTDYKKRTSKAASIIFQSCLSEIRPYLKGLQALGICGRLYRREVTQLLRSSAEQASFASSEMHAPKKTSKYMPTSQNFVNIAIS